MKKTAVCFVLAVGIMASLSSCLTTYKMVVDTNIPEDQTVTVTFVNDDENGIFIVKEWNDTNIVKELYGNKYISGNDKTKLTVPAGNTSFAFDAYFTLRSTTHSLKNIELRYNLEQGKEYHIKGFTKSLGLFKGHEVLVRIYDAADSTLLKEWKLGET
jgi:hypothetical protein